MSTSPNLPANNLIRSHFGLNLDEVNDYVSACPLVDRMTFARSPTAINAHTPICGFDPDTGLPTEAGALGRAIPIDPITTEGLATSHTYVLLCDEGVDVVNTPWGQIKPVNGRGTLTNHSASDGVGLEIHAKGPVKKFHFLRAEHEKSFLAGDVFNPEYIHAVAPFPILRPLDLTATNEKTYPLIRAHPSDGYFSNARGGLPAEYLAQLAKRTSAKLWYPIHPMMTNSDLLATAQVLAAFGLVVDFEWGNELGWTYQVNWMRSQASLAYGKLAVNYFDVLRYYGWRAGQMAKIVAQVSPRFKVNLASQASNGDSNLPYILKGWDESGAPRSLIAGYANASYLNLDSVLPQLLDLMAKDDKDGFYALLSSLAGPLQTRHLKAIAACKAANISYKIYEGGPSLYTSRPIMTDDAARFALQTWANPLLHTEQAATIVMKMYRDVRAAGATEVLHFKFSGRGNQFGTWGLTPHLTLPPYPLYNALIAG